MFTTMSSMSSPEFDESHARSHFQRLEHLIFIINHILPLIPKKQGPLPASELVIENLQTVTSAPEDEDCPICLTEFGGGEVKELWCKHMFHKECAEKWLGVSATCPVCRYEMPAVAGPVDSVLLERLKRRIQRRTQR